MSAIHKRALTAHLACICAIYHLSLLARSCAAQSFSLSEKTSKSNAERPMLSYKRLAESLLSDSQEPLRTGHVMQSQSKADSGDGLPGFEGRPFAISEYTRLDRFMASSWNLAVHPGHMSVTLGALLLLAAFLLGALTRLLLHFWQEKPPLHKEHSRFEACNMSPEWQVYSGYLYGIMPVAVKRLKLSSQPDQKFQQQMKLLRGLRNPNIVPFLGVCRKGDSLMLVTDYLPQGDLRQALDRDCDRKFSWYLRGKRIALDIARGVAFLHSHGIVHLSLTSRNVLLCESGAAKVADAGLRCLLSDSSVSQATNVYAAPELKPSLKFAQKADFCSATSKADVFSLGVVLWELFTGENPCCSARGVEVPLECPVTIRALINDCLSEDPEKRPNMTNVVEALMRAVGFPHFDTSQTLPGALPTPSITHDGAFSSEEALQASRSSLQASRHASESHTLISGFEKVDKRGSLAATTAFDKTFEKQQSEDELDETQSLGYIGGLEFMHRIDLQLGGMWLDVAELDIPRNEGSLKIVPEIGNSGRVRLALWRNERVAVKILTHPRDQQEGLMREVTLLGKCCHPHIVQLFGADLVWEDRFVVVMEYMSGGDLHTKLQHDKNGKLLDRQRRREIALGIARGLVYLHDQGIAHLNLQPSQILLTANLMPKISGIGVAQHFHSIGKGSEKNASQGAPYLSPEQLMGKPCGLASDIFAFGRILWELCAGIPLVDRSCRSLAVPTEASQEVQDLIDSCHALKPECRPSAAGVYTILRAADF